MPKESRVKKARIDVLRKEMARKEEALFGKDPTGPVYLELKRQIDALKAELFELTRHPNQI